MFTFLAVIGFATGIYLGLRKKVKTTHTPRITQ